MARQQYATQPYMKHLEVFTDFSGGLNTVTTNDKLSNNELPNLTNMNLGDRGALVRRDGMKRHLTPTANGFAQGYFRYYTGSIYKQILAVDGRFEVEGVVASITGLASFQTTRPIEGVQFGDKMYFATGTELVVYNGTTFSVVEPYKPQPLEALYIGTNGLADDPNNFMVDGVGSFLRLDGVTFSSRYGIMNQDFTLTTYATIPVGMAVEYLFEWRTPFMEDGFWSEGKAWSTSKTWTYRANFEGDMQFRVSARQAGTEVAEVQYLVPKYKVKAAPDPTDTPIDTTYLNRCNRILLHWGRLVLYGDEVNPDTMYLSHLNNPAYFPVPNSLRFLNPRREGLTALVPYRDMIVAFTPNSIQALYGKSPTDFKRVMLNTSIGCIAPYSPAVVRNYVAFLSQEGVHYLKSLGYTEDKANVEKVDKNVDNIVTRSADVCGIYQDGQYQLTFPSEGKRLRLYAETGSWAKDESSKLNFQRMFAFDGKVYGQNATTGDILVSDKDINTDDGVAFVDSFETKNLDFGQPFHRKKLKELKMIVAPVGGDVNASVTVYADSEAILSPDESYATVDPDTREVVWVPHFETNFYAGSVFGDWILGEEGFGTTRAAMATLPISGKCFTVKVKYEHAEAVASTILGMSVTFKLKKP